MVTEWVFEISACAKDVVGLLLVGIAVIVLVLLLLFSLPLVIEAMFLIIAVILFAVAVVVLVGAISAIPYFFIKRGPTSEPANDYSLDEINAVKEDERK